MKGVKIWKNPDNGFVIFRLHYSADPAKDPDTKEGKDWYKRVIAPIPKAHREVEYEINFTVRAGRAVFPAFSVVNHTGELAARPRGFLYRGWDFGELWPAVAICQDNTTINRFEILEVFLGHNIAFRVFAEEVIKWCDRCWPRSGILDACDPQGAWANPQGMEDKSGARNPVEYLQDTHHLDVRWSYTKPTNARDMISELLVGLPKINTFAFGVNKNETHEIFFREPGTHIYSGTQILIDGMAGGFYFKKMYDGGYSKNPAKTKSSHPIDAMMHAYLRAREDKDIREDDEPMIVTGQRLQPDKYGVIF